MPVVETCLAVLNVADQATRLFDWFTGVSMGDQLKRALAELESTKAEVRRLSEHVLYSPGVQQVFSTSGPSRLLEGDEHVSTLLVPLSESLGTEMLATAVVSTPIQLREAFQKDPWEVLVEVRPVARAKHPPNPDLVPVIFTDSGVAYVGWQARGALPLLLGCDFEPSLQSARPSGDGVMDPLQESELFRVRAVKRFWFTSHINCRLVITNQRLKFEDPEDPQYSFELSWELLHAAEIERKHQDLVIVLPGSASYEVGFLSEAECDLALRAVQEHLLQSAP